MTETVEDILEHYGTKGMKWGVRKRSSDSGSSGKEPVKLKVKGGQIKTAGGKGHPVSEDAQKAAVARQKAKESGRNSLTNAEMRSVVERMNLEQQYSKLNPKELKGGKKFANDLLDNADLVLPFLKFGMKDIDDPRVKLGLQVAEGLAKARKKK